MTKSCKIIKALMKIGIVCYGYCAFMTTFSGILTDASREAIVEKLIVFTAAMLLFEGMLALARYVSKLCR